MRSLNLKGDVGGKLAIAAAVVGFASLVGIDVAMAGTDTTFDTALTQFPTSSRVRAVGSSPSSRSRVA